MEKHFNKYVRKSFRIPLIVLGLLAAFFGYMAFPPASRETFNPKHISTMDDFNNLKNGSYVAFQDKTLYYTGRYIQNRVTKSGQLASPDTYYYIMQFYEDHYILVSVNASRFADKTKPASEITESFIARVERPDSKSTDILTGIAEEITQTGEASYNEAWEILYAHSVLKMTESGAGKQVIPLIAAFIFFMLFLIIAIFFINPKLSFYYRRINQQINPDTLFEALNRAIEQDTVRIAYECFTATDRYVLAGKQFIFTDKIMWAYQNVWNTLSYVKVHTSDDRKILLTSTSYDCTEILKEIETEFPQIMVGYHKELASMNFEQVKQIWEQHKRNTIK